jgi:hypothetical protein
MPFRKVHKAGTGKRWVLFLENENKKGVKGTGILATYNWCRFKQGNLVVVSVDIYFYIIISGIPTL